MDENKFYGNRVSVRFVGKSGGLARPNGPDVHPARVEGPGKSATCKVMEDPTGRQFACNIAVQIRTDGPLGLQEIIWKPGSRAVGPGWENGRPFGPEFSTYKFDAHTGTYRT